MNRYKSILFSPLQIFLGLTYRCNLACPHCYSKNRKSSHEMSKKDVISLIDQISEMGVFKIVVSHGETLLRKDWFELLSYIKKKGIHLTLITNGTKVTNNVIQKLKKIDIDKIMVSVDSAREKVHDEFRGKNGTWKSALKALKLIKNSNIKTSMAVALSEINCKEIDDIINLGLSLCVDEISVLTIRPQSKNYQFIKGKDYEKVIKKIWKMRSKYRKQVEILIHDPLAIPILKSYHINDYELVGLNKCGAGHMFLSISPEGNVMPCNFIPLIIGNVKSETLKEIYSRVKFLDGLNTPPSLCVKCKYSETCQGGCKSFSFYAGSILKRDPRCAGRYNVS